MNAPMRMAPSCSSLRRDVDEHQRPPATSSSAWVPIATIEAMPPSDVPTSTGGWGKVLAMAYTSPANASGP